MTLNELKAKLDEWDKEGVILRSQDVIPVMRGLFALLEQCDSYVEFEARWGNAEAEELLAILRSEKDV